MFISNATNHPSYKTEDDYQKSEQDFSSAPTIQDKIISKLGELTVVKYKISKSKERWENLPSELFDLIFEKLQKNSLLNVCLVSRKWREEASRIKIWNSIGLRTHFIWSSWNDLKSVIQDAVKDHQMSGKQLYALTMQTYPAARE